MSAPGLHPYLRDAVLTASPEQLHLMLYDGALRFATQARDALERRDYEGSYNKLSRAQAIVNEMEAGLRPEVNAELCERMAATYNFIYRKLVEANVNKSVESLDNAVKVLLIERETWSLLVRKISDARTPAATARASASATPELQLSTLSIEG